MSLQDWLILVVGVPPAVYYLVLVFQMVMESKEEEKEAEKENKKEHSHT